jgi:hypothetical protein
VTTWLAPVAPGSGSPGHGNAHPISRPDSSVAGAIIASEATTGASTRCAGDPATTSATRPSSTRGTADAAAAPDEPADEQVLEEVDAEVDARPPDRAISATTGRAGHHARSVAASSPQMAVAFWACPDGSPKLVSVTAPTSGTQEARPRRVPAAASARC